MVKKTHAFSLFEILISFSIIAMVLSLLLSSYTYVVKRKIDIINQTKATLFANTQLISGLKQIKKGQMYGLENGPLYIESYHLCLSLLKSKECDNDLIAQKIEATLFDTQQKELCHFPLTLLLTPQKNKENHSET